MTTKIGSKVLIYEEEPQLCEYCGKVKETRPYGINGAEICFDCAMSTPENGMIVRNSFEKLLE